MFFPKSSGLLLLISLLTGSINTAVGADVAWFAPTAAANSNANFPSVQSNTYTTNFGVAFTTGTTPALEMDWVTLGLNTSSVTSGSGTFKLSLRNTTNTTAYSAAAGSTELAVDTVSFTMPTTVSTAFTLNLTSADIPNITNYAMGASTSYALIMYNTSVNIGVGRTTGYAANTTNGFYTLTNGFTALNTFRNNNTYSNNSSSYPSLQISFGNTVPVPEPSTWAMAGIATLVLAYRARRKQLVRG